MEKKGLLLLLQKVLVWVSFKRLIMLFFASLVLIFSLAIFENRSVLIEAWNTRDAATVPKQPDIKFSSFLEEQIKLTTNESDSIVGVVVHAVNLKVNEKRTIFQYSDTPGLTQLFDLIIKQRGATGTMFDNDQQNNLQMVSVVNGEFSCTKIEDTQIYRSYPDIAQHAKTICRISIPPFYGNFSGFVSLWIKDPLSDGVSTQMRLNIVRLSSEIYRELVLTRRLSQN